MSGSGQQSHGAALSPSEYAKSTGLQSLLNKAVNDCYLAQSPCPAATMSQLLQSTYTLDTFSDISISEVFDGEGSGGGFTAEVAVQLAGGQRVSTMVSHSNSTVPFHPNSNTTGRKIALIPYEVLAATGPGSLQSVLCPPPTPPPQVVSKKGGAGSDKTPAGDGAAGGAASSTNASNSNSVGVAGTNSSGGAQGSGGGMGDVDPSALVTAAALTKATRFRLGSSIEFYNKRVKTSLMQLRAVAQQQIDDALFHADSPTNASTPTAGLPFSNLLGQVAAAISLACAKSAAAALNKPLAIYIGGLYKGICEREDPYALAVQLSTGGVGNSGNKASGSSSPPHSLNSTVTMRSGTPMFDDEILSNREFATGIAGSSNSKQPLAIINPSFYSIPDLVVTVFSTDPRGMGKVRVREVCLVVKVQSAQAEALYSANHNSNNNNNNSGSSRKYGVESSMTLNGSTSYGGSGVGGGVPKQQNYGTTLAGRSSELLSPMGAAALRASQSGILGMDTVAALHAIIDTATSKAAAIAAAQCGASAAEVEASMMPTMPDGSVRFPFWESVEQIVSTMESSIREVVSAQGNNAIDNSDNSTSGVFSVFSVGLVLDGGLCYRPQLDKYALVNGEPELTGAMLSEMLAAVVGGAAATSTAQQQQQQASGGAGGSNQQNQNPAGPSSFNPSSPPPSDLVIMPSGVVTYLEDTHASSDLLAMQRLMYRVGGAPPPRSVVIAGNHLYGTDATALSQGARLKLTNNATLRMNDVGRLWTLLERARFYRNCFPGASVGLTGEVSEGDGAALAHIAIGIHAKTLRVGGMLRREHAAIVNEMVRMSEYLAKAGLLAKQPPQYDNSRMARPPRPAEIVAEVVAAPVKKGARK